MRKYYNIKEYYIFKKPIIELDNTISLWKNDIIFFNNKIFNNKNLEPYEFNFIYEFINNKNLLILIPRLSLIEYYISKLDEINIKYLKINKDFIFNEKECINLFYNELDNENIKFIFLTPDMIYINKNNYFSLIEYILKNCLLLSFIIEDIHSISIKSDKYNYKYMEIKNIKNKFTNINILGIIDNFNNDNILDIKNNLYLNDIKEIYFNFNIDNLYIKLLSNIDNQLSYINKILSNNDEQCIIFCHTMNQCEVISNTFNKKYKIKSYYFNYNNKNFYKTLLNFKNNEYQILVSNISICKKEYIIFNNIKYIFNLDIPNNLYYYYLQIGIVGYNISLVKNIIFYNEDIINKYLSNILKQFN